MAGRPRTSAAILKLRGSFIANPERAREDAPGAAPWYSEPPEHLTGKEKAAWHEIVELLPKVALTATERVGVEQMARIRAQLKDTIAADPNFAKLDARLHAWAVQMGMTLQARAKLGTSAKDAPKNKFSELKGDVPNSA